MLRYIIIFYLFIFLFFYKYANFKLWATTDKLANSELEIITNVTNSILSSSKQNIFYLNLIDN